MGKKTRRLEAATTEGSGPESASGPLTDREHTVLQLVAEGLSNRAIAERLMSPSR